MMKIVRYVLAAGLLGCAVARAASFDCERASTRVERLVCDQPSLGKLDEQLGEAYSRAAQHAPEAEAGTLARAQSTWLRTIRNACADAACLEAAYEARIDALDPLADKKLTCDKMRRQGAQIFAADTEVDLGSGYGSPIEVDYDCPDSLSELPFMQQLMQLAEKIRAEPGSRICTGTIIYFERRYYLFGLTQAGLAPRTMPGWSSHKDATDWASYVEQDRSGTAIYFRQWSEQSRANQAQYEAFAHEFDRAGEQLESHYVRHFGMTPSEARSAANVALAKVVTRASGSASKSAVHEEFPLLDALRSHQQDASQIREAVAALTSSQALTALKVALINRQPVNVIAELADAVGPATLSDAGAVTPAGPRRRPRDIESTPEPLLALAIGDLGNLAYLLENDVPVDAANGFGKTALFYAIGTGDHAAVELLLRHHANARATYRTAIELRPDDDECIYPELRHTGRTTLMHAAQNSDVRMLKLLLNAGAPLTARDDLGFNARDYALMGGSSVNAAYLASLGLEPAARK